MGMVLLAAGSSDEPLELTLRMSLDVCVCNDGLWRLIDETGVPKVDSNAWVLVGNQLEIIWGHCMQKGII